MNLIKKVASLVLVLIIAGFIYQTVTTHIDKKRYLPSGQFINVEGVNFHYQLSGQGQYTVVFDSGMGDSQRVWRKVKALLPQKGIRVFSYDRAGLGYSGNSANDRTSENMTVELKQLLEAVGISESIILVGHSLGGLNAQLFAKNYPKMVVGLVLVDSAHEGQSERLPPANQLQSTVFKMGMRAAPIGIPRLYLSLNDKTEQALKSTTKHQYTLLAESNSFSVSQESISFEPRSLGDLPIYVISRNSSVEQLKEQTSSKYRLEWAKLQNELLALSRNSEQVFTGQKYHSIHLRQPELVAEKIMQLLGKAL